MTLSKRSIAFLSVLTVFSGALPAYAASAFSDMKESDFGYESAAYLKDRRIMTGFEDGSFRPDQKVNRAEAMKILGFPLINGDVSAPKEDPFDDVSKNDWFAPYVAWGVTKNIINGSDKSSDFRPQESITKAEFIKMMLTAYGVDTKAHGDIELPLATDVADVKQWYYPYFRYALASSVIVTPKSGLLAPGRELTRIDVAVLLYRFLLYKDGKRTQDLLDATTLDLVGTLDALEQNDVKRAELASARALLQARGALAVMPNETAVKVAVKTSEAIRSLVRAYKAGITDDLDNVIKLSSDAWYIAEQARKISPDASTIATQIQNYAKTFADSARARKKK